MRRASMLSRLALALLALWGFVAPLAPERDRVAQTCGAGAGARKLEAQPAGVQPRITLAAVPRGVAVPPAARPFEVQTSRRYLLHRAWLL